MKYFWPTLVFIIGEIIGIFIFAAVKKFTKLPKDSPARVASIQKGILERAVLFVGLLNGFPQVLIAFGALKLGTRLHDEKKGLISNTYFLVGNLTSILLAMLYTIVTKQLWKA